MRPQLYPDSERHARKREKAREYYDKNREEIQRKDRERYAAQREERKQWQKDYRANNRKYVADRDAARKYGISVEEVTKLRENTHCQICSAELSHYTKNGASIDHCHTTGKVRGVLCGKCNKGIGLFDDNPDHLQSAINYLKETGS